MSSSSIEVRTYVPTEHRVRMLVYGGSGVGKTVFAATAPKALFLAVEDGLLSLADKNVQYVKISNLQDMRNILAALKSNTLKDKDGKPMEFETIVIDSLTEVQNVAIKFITGGRKPSMNQWGDFAEVMAEILKGFTSLDKHIIFTCLEAEKGEEDDDGKEYTRFQPELFGKLAEKTQAMMDFVGRYYMKTTVVDDKPTAKRVLTFSYSPRYKAKDRSGKLPQFADPDFKKLMKEFVKIKLGEGEVTGSAPAPDQSGNVGSNGKSMPPPPPVAKPVPFPVDKGDKMLVGEGLKFLNEVWDDFAARMKIAPESKEAKRDSMLLKYCGVNGTKWLRVKQGSKLAEKIVIEIKKITKEKLNDDEVALENYIHEFWTKHDPEYAAKNPTSAAEEEALSDVEKAENAKHAEDAK